MLAPPTYNPATSDRTFLIAASSASALTILPALSATFAVSAPSVRLHLEAPEASMGLTRGDATAVMALLPDTIPSRRLAQQLAAPNGLRVLERRSRCRLHSPLML